MNTQQFLALDAAAKAALLKGAEHVSERYEPSYTVLLYHINGLYIEAFHHRREGVVQYNCITNIQALRPYMPLPEGLAKAPATAQLVADSTGMAVQATSKGRMSRLAALLQQTVAFIFRRTASQP